MPDHVVQWFGRLLDDSDAKAGLGAVAADRYDPAAANIPVRIHLATEKLHTLGAWGEAA